MPSPLDIAKLLSKIPWKAILQRMLGVWNIGFIIFCFIGPVMYPILYSAYFIILHVIFAVQNVRNYIGSYNGYHQCVKHSKTDWAQRYCDEANVTSIHGLAHDLPFGSVNHIIIVPNYLESMETLIDTLDVLASHDMALTNYIVCLAMEETEYEATRKGDSLVHMYRDSFLSIVFTLHPSDTAGEVRGKSSNVGHAAKIMAKQTSLLSSSVFTIIDADTCFSQDYFTCLSYHFAIASPSDRQMMLFSPCTVFDRNGHQVPSIVRTVDFCWSAGVMSNLYPGSPIPFPCSAYSLSANLAKSAGFWDTGPEAIGEDMHMFLKCFFATQGCFKAIPVFCPASQCNIQEQTTYQTLLARYTQAKRHMFGCLDWGYVLRRSMFAVLAPGFDSQERNVVLSVPVLGPNDEHSRATLISKIPHLIHRMAEANFAMGHFFSLVAISSFQLVESTHPYVIGAHWLGGWIRFICTMAYVVSLYYYEKYQRWSAIDRWELSKAEKENAGCGQGVMDLGKRSELKYVRRWYQIMDWLLIPLSGVFFLTLPQLHAHSLHLVTDKLDYKVAGKPLISESILGELVTSGSMDSIASLAEADEDKRADSGYFQVPDRYNSNRGENQISHV